MIDYVLQIIDGRIQLSLVPLAPAERSIEVGQMPLGEVDSLQLPPMSARQLYCVSQIRLGLFDKTACIVVKIPLPVDRQHQIGDENQPANQSYRSTKPAGFVRAPATMASFSNLAILRIQHLTHLLSVKPLQP
jgi:hypothetical protein